MSIYELPNIKKQKNVRIVGDDDRGRLFTPEEYEEYKKKMIPQVDGWRDG